MDTNICHLIDDDDDDAISDIQATSRLCSALLLDSETLESSDLTKEVAEDKKEEGKKKCDEGSEERGESCAAVH